MTFQFASFGARCRSVISAIIVVLACSSVRGNEPESVKPASGPDVIFSAPLKDAPGKNLVVVHLTFGPTQQHVPVDHRHPGSVYVYVTRGAVRLGIDGQPVREVHAGESFFEPPGALHTVAESASATDSAEAIAVMIVPEGAPLTIREGEKK